MYGKRDAEGRVKVYLTRLGGGVFNNPQDEIDNAIIAAVNSKELENSGLDVILNNYETVDYSFCADTSCNLQNLVNSTNGTITCYNTEPI